MRSYIYRGEPEQRVFGALPEGDYAYVVSDCGEPYQKDNGNWVVRVKLAIQPNGVPVYPNPWAGIDKNGEERDGIGEFLLSCNRAPKPGSEPDWARVVGARGRCRLKVKKAEQGSLSGKDVNEVHYFYRPKQVGPAAEQQSRQSFSPEEVAKAAQDAQRMAGKDPDLDVEPDDIPF